MSKPRWNSTKFGGKIELTVGRGWIGGIEPLIGGVHRYKGRNCQGQVPSLDEAKRAVKPSADLPNVPMTPRVRASVVQS